MSLILLLLIMQALHFVCTWRLYVLAGQKAWQAAVPVYSAIVLMRIVQRPWWWVILLYIPVVGNVMALVIWSDTCRAFGFRRFWEVLLTLLTLGLYLAWISYSGKAVYDAKYKEHRNALDSSILGAIVFATVAASAIKAFTYEAYTIPSSSMEGTMLIGDFLFVNKMSYGTRIAMTPLSFPLVHDTIPLVKTRSYVKGVSLPYLRLPALRKIKRNDIVVFNWPADSAEKPIDKRMNYIKRCVAVAGDSLEIRQGVLYVNGREQAWNLRAEPQWEYRLELPNSFYQYLLKMGLEVTFVDYDRAKGTEIVFANLSEKNLDKVQATFPGIQTEKMILQPGEHDRAMFPAGASYNVDNYGPLYIPKKGDHIALTLENLPQYRDVIAKYEGNSLEVRDGQIWINGAPQSEYTIRQDYYFMMGDNRHNSLDSRYWGYVPHDHIVGTPAMIWLSIAPDDGSTPLFKRIRTERVFSFPGSDSPVKSYFWPIVIAGGVLYGAYKILRKKKKDDKKTQKPGMKR